MKQISEQTTALNILFCLAYFILATLGFEWGALTANATLLWPPSGLAVFGCMVFGRKLLPGLLLGAIISSKTISLAHPFSNTFFSIVVATLIGCASILQAAVIATFTRKYYRCEFRISTLQAIIFTATVSLGCVISSTLGNSVLLYFGIINLTTALQNWAVWWVGDVIGVLVITPLLLWIYHKKYFYKNAQAHAFLIFCAGVGIVFLTVAAIGHNEHDSQRKNRAHHAENLQFSIQTNVDLITRDLNALQEYFLNNSPDQIEFQKMTEPFLRRNLWLNSFSWIPTTPASRIRKNSPLIMDFSAALGMTRADKSNLQWKDFEDEDFPKELLSNIKTHLSPVQSEISSNHTNTISSSDIGPSFSIISPVVLCTTENKDSCNILSLLKADVNLTRLVGSAIVRNQQPNIDIALRIKSDFTAGSFWKWNGSQLQQSSEDARLIKVATRVDGKIPAIKIAGNEWQLLISDANLSIWFLPNLQQIIVLAIGLVIVILLSAYLQALHRQDQLIIENQAKLKEEIKNQTSALRSANESLVLEIENKRLTQEQLKASEAHMRTLLDNIPDPIWFKSTEGVYLSINKTVSNLFKRREEEIVGKHVADYVNLHFENIIDTYEKAVLESEESIRRELWMHIPLLNEQRLMDTIKVAVRDEHKNPIGILSIARDITEQHQLINELEKFKRFAEYASEGFSIMTLAADTLYMNRSMQKMLSSEDSTLHNKFYTYFPSDLRQQWEDIILPCVLSKGYWQGELSALRSDGSRFPTKETFFIIRDDKGQPIYFGEVMIDISEQKQVEKSLQLAKDTAEEATRAKSRFLANMSHEIRTPPNAVLGYSQLLIADSRLSTQQHERLNAIFNAGQRLLYLINDILDLSKIEAGALQVREQFFDMRQELNDIAALMRTKTIAKGLAFTYQVQLPTPAIVKSDRQKIGQIILNLLGNAIKFTAQGEIQLNVVHDEHSILIEVIDTGPGISKEELKSLFAPFKQGKSGEESGGTGLGLVISKNIAEKLGGELTMDSELDSGTHARLRLPITIEQDIQIDNVTSDNPIELVADGYCRVLVVEDDNASRDVLVNLLRNIGCDVVEAVNGAEGLQKALESHPDIIFTDIRMPELNGSDMLRALRKTVAQEHLPVIAVSASSLAHERSFYLAEGFNEFIGKPYQFSDIYSALKKFTRLVFRETQQSSIAVDDDNERGRWKNRADLETLQAQLQTLKTSFTAGDMTASKKLFAQQSEQSLGKDSHHKIQSAMRLYDLVLAETYLNEVLADITDQLNAT